MSIEAMKQALEALEWDADYDTSVTLQKAAITALKQAIEFEEMVKKGTKAWDGTPDDWVDDLRGGAEAEKQEAVAWMWKDGTLTSDPDVADGTWIPLFTAPVHASDISQEPVDETAKREREWVGLTDTQIDEIMRPLTQNQPYSWRVFARAIEAKLKEKNA